MQIVIEELNECKIEQKNQVESWTKKYYKKRHTDYDTKHKVYAMWPYNHLYPCVHCRPLQQLLLDTKAMHNEIYADESCLKIAPLKRSSSTSSFKL